MQDLAQACFPYPTRPDDRTVLIVGEDAATFREGYYYTTMPSTVVHWHGKVTRPVRFSVVAGAIHHQPDTL